MDGIEIIDPFVFDRALCMNVRVVDGDTVKADIQLQKTNIFLSHYIRLQGIDVAEKNTRTGKSMKDILTLIIRQHVDLHREVRVSSKGKDCYGRVLGVLHISHPKIIEDTVNDYFLNNGLCVKADKRVIRTSDRDILEYNNSLRELLKLTESNELK